MTESTQQTDPRMTSSIVYQVPYMSEVCTDIPYGKNTSIDLFLEEALRCNAPVSLINYPGGNHYFDIIDESKESIGAIKIVLEFFHCYLSD